MTLSIGLVNDRLLKVVGRLRQLKFLSLSGESCTITDKGLQALQHLQHLELLIICDGETTKQGLARLKKKLPKARIPTQ